MTQNPPTDAIDTADTADTADTDASDTAVIDYDLLSALASGDRPEPPGRLSASLTHGWRAMLRIKHVPEQIIDVTIFPVVMLVLFTYLFGGALSDGGTREYLQFFLPGVLVTTVLMITMYVGMGLSTDAEKGVFDRFRSLPMWRPAAIVGPLLGDAVRYTLASIMMITLGLVLGYRPEGGGALGTVLAVLVLIVFAFCLSWVWTLLGLLMRNEKAVTNASMMILFPLTFLSNVFVDPDTMPGWLQAFVDINPVSHVVTATRGLMNGDVTAAELGTVALIAGLLIGIFAPPTMRLYRTKS